MNHLVVPIGVSHISLRHKKYNQGSGRKRTKNKRTIWAWVNSSARRLCCDTLHSLCICRLTLVCISSEISTKLPGMPTYPDWPSLTAFWPYLMPTGLFYCPVSTGQLPLCVSLRQLHTSGRVEISSSGLCLVSRQNRQRDGLLSEPPT